MKAWVVGYIKKPAPIYFRNGNVIRYKIKRNINLQSVHFCRTYML